MNTILHTVNKSPFAHQALAQCLERIKTGDSLLLLEDGVYGALSSHTHADKIRSLTVCYAIKADIEARGLRNKQLSSNIQFIDYNQFVTLSTEHELVQSWY